MQGTRITQSLMVLKSYNLNPIFIPGYDYLDDIEAFFWVFAYIILTYTPHGHRMPYKDHRTLPVWLWSHGSPCAIFARKWTFLHTLSAAHEAQYAMHAGWTATCGDLFLEFREFVREISYEKQRLLYKGRKELGRPAPDRFTSLLAKVEEHYSRVLGMFDEALKKAADTSVDESVSVPSPVPSATVTSPRQSTSEYVEPKLASVDTSATSLPTERSLTLSTKPETPAEQPAAVTSPRSSKRRYDEAELNDSPVESKRRCPPSRRALSGVLSSAYGYCRRWF